MYCIRHKAKESPRRHHRHKPSTGVYPCAGANSFLLICGGYRRRVSHFEKNNGSSLKCTSSSHTPPMHTFPHTHSLSALSPQQIYTDTVEDYMRGRELSAVHSSSSSTSSPLVKRRSMSGMYSLSLKASALLRNSRYVSAGSPGSPVAARTSAASSALRYTHPSRPWPSARQAPSWPCPTASPCRQRAPWRWRRGWPQRARRCARHRRPWVRGCPPSARTRGPGACRTGRARAAPTR